MDLQQCWRCRASTRGKRRFECIKCHAKVCRACCTVERGGVFGKGGTVWQIVKCTSCQEAACAR